MPKTIFEKLLRINADAGLYAIEKEFAKYKQNEYIPFAKGTSLIEVCRNVFPDKQGTWANPVFVCEVRQITTIGITELTKRVKNYLENKINDGIYDMDILSIMAGIIDDKISVVFFVRIYGIPDGQYCNFEDINDFINPNQKETLNAEENKLIIPDKIIYQPDEILEHEEKVRYQKRAYENATEDMPFLNSIESYEQKKLPEYRADQLPVYDLLTKDKQISTILSYEDFISIFRQSMQYITSVELDSYYSVVRGKMEKEMFMDIIEDYLKQNFIQKGLMKPEDLHVMLEKLERSLFDLYIVQDLIDDPDITDIKIVSPDSIRVRIKGKAYLSNITFIDDEDYFRFIQGIVYKNRIDLNIATQTFTDERDENYILRFSITSPYITPGYPIIHIRKVSRKKLMAPDLMQAGMFDEKIKNYLLDCGKYSRGVVFSGPPGSGKTNLLNWFLEEAYEDSAEILVIQENDELFAYRQGVMFEHVVNNPKYGEQACSLEQLGQMALVAGANVFVIGEAKGAEICSAITLSNSGCRTAITIHSPSATETIDKMADLAMRGYAQSYEQAIRMMKSFQTIVYLNEFKVQDIVEIEGYDEDRKKLKYRYIYKRK